METKFDVCDVDQWKIPNTFVKLSQPQTPALEPEEDNTC